MQNRPWMPFTPLFTSTALVVKVRGRAARWTTRPPTWSPASTRTGSSTCWASGLGTAEGSRFWRRCSRAPQPRDQGRPVRVLRRARGLPDAIGGDLAQGDGADLRSFTSSGSSMKYVSWKERKEGRRAIAAHLHRPQRGRREDCPGEPWRPISGRKAGMVAAWNAPGTTSSRSSCSIPPSGSIYTTNAIESVNFQLRKITKNRGHFPTDEAAIKLSLPRDQECHRASHRRRRAGSRKRTAGTGTLGWKAAMNAFAVTFPTASPSDPDAETTRSK